MTFYTPAGNRWDLFEDMTHQTHLLIAGAAGSGKSVAINGIISTILFRSPLQAQLILIDPKRVELADYANLPHTICHADGFAPEKWLKALNTAVNIMDKRYEEMKRQRVKMYQGGDIYVIIDEWAAVFKNGGSACYKQTLRLVSEGRAAKVHVIMATQVPKANIIPTEIRENFTARLCLMTANATQSRVIMDMNGCETLPDPKAVGYALGYYVLPGRNRKLYTIPYVPQEELDRLVNHWESQYSNFNPEKPKPKGLLGLIAKWLDCGQTYDV